MKTIKQGLPHLMVLLVGVLSLCSVARAESGPSDTQRFTATRNLADQGNSGAQYNLGMLYDIGIGTPQDDAQAVVWYRKSADQGNAYGQSGLSGMYFNGRGVPQDYVQAYMWISLAASHNTANVKYRDIVAAKMTREQIAEGQKLASNWRPKTR